jgi:hypothetical protein
MKTDSGAEPVTQRKSTRRSPTDPDRSFSTLASSAMSIEVTVPS